MWIRLAGTLGAILFAITAARIFWGEQVLPTASPLPFFAYPLLVLTFASWIWTLLKRDGKNSTRWPVTVSLLVTASRYPT